MMRWRCAAKKQPNVVVLDIMLPDMDGFDVCRELRGNWRTSHIPIIFLTQRDKRSDKIAGLKLGADDYMTKPFDIEELKLRVQGALRRAERESLADPVTGLPGSRIVEERLSKLFFDQSWALVYIGISHYGFYKEAYGFLASNDVLLFVAMILSEVVSELGTADDFIGHVGGDDFILITTAEKAPILCQRLVERFQAKISTFYSFKESNENKAPFMSLAIGMISDESGAYADIHEIIEAAAEARRMSRCS